VSQIRLEKLTKVYPDGTKAVDALDLEVGDGEFVVLVGPSGCGKTTALRMVAGLEDITDGRVWIGDEVANKVPPKDRDVAMIFQNYALYPHMSAAANMGFALKMQGVPKREIATRVENAARVLGLSEVLKKRPRTLSGGQRQRVAIARAFLKNAPTLILDEATSHLDAVSEAQVRGALDALMRDRTTVVIAHRLSTVRNADMLVVLENGRVVEIGSHAELVARNGLYARLIRRQLGGDRERLRAVGN
jgi:multiple sugar transport system ATP-binding protein